MIKITIPDNNIEERTYILNVLFSDFLGLDILISHKETNNYTVELANNSKLIIKDAFFSNYPKNLEYLKVENIPSSTKEIESPFGDKQKLQVLYGNNTFSRNKTEIICGLDIFASSFFMLTRWEEFVIKEKDEHERFSDFSALAYKNNFHKRPIVNEYIEFLWQMISLLDSTLERKKRDYSLTITHDVDRLRRYDSFAKYIKAVAGDIIHRKNLLMCFSTTKDYLGYKLNLKNDPYDTFDYLMDISEKYNQKSYFYFIPNKINEKEAEYDIESIEAEKSIKNINKRGHIVGLHGSYDGFNKEQTYTSELKRINNIGPKVKEGRQHFLRFDNPRTWQIWEDNKLKTDSTMGFTHFAGFRSGICYPYPTYNILTRTRLKLIEMPLIAMEGAVANELPLIDDFLNEFINLSDICKKYNGNFVFLWHNNNFNIKEWQDYSKQYESIIKSII